MEYKCPKDGTALELSPMVYIEECPTCGYCYDVAHDKEVDRAWVYGNGYPDDEEYEDDEDYDEYHTCDCPFCFCGTHVQTAGETCNSCLEGSHQG